MVLPANWETTNKSTVVEMREKLKTTDRKTQEKKNQNADIKAKLNQTLQKSKVPTLS